MTDVAFPTESAPCTNCMDKVEMWVSHDDGTNWYEVPNVTRIQKQANRQNAQQIKLQGESQNVCSSSSKAWTYLVNIWDCLDFQILNFMRDGDTFWARMVNGDDLANSQQEVVKVTFDDDGYLLDDQSRTPQNTTLRLDASTIFRQNYEELTDTTERPAEVGNVNDTLVGVTI